MEQSTNETSNIKKQMALYFFFAICMIILNYAIQKTNQIFIASYICSNFGDLEIFKVYYCSKNPYNMPEFVGSIFAVGLTYITKFLLDKFIVFQKKAFDLKGTSKEFLKYFGFAILTTIENIGIQFILTNFSKTPLEISLIIALTIGYSIKFLLDRKYVFAKNLNHPLR